jgi:hypothetical protein
LLYTHTHTHTATAAEEKIENARLVAKLLLSKVEKEKSELFRFFAHQKNNIVVGKFSDLYSHLNN